MPIRLKENALCIHKLCCSGVPCPINVGINMILFSTKGLPSPNNAGLSIPPMISL